MDPTQVLGLFQRLLAAHSPGVGAGLQRGGATEALSQWATGSRVWPHLPGGGRPRTWPKERCGGGARRATARGGSSLGVSQQRGHSSHGLTRHRPGSTPLAALPALFPKPLLTPELFWGPAFMPCGAPWNTGWESPGSTCTKRFRSDSSLRSWCGLACPAHGAAPGCGSRGARLPPCSTASSSLPSASVSPLAQWGQMGLLVGSAGRALFTPLLTPCRALPRRAQGHPLQPSTTAAGPGPDGSPTRGQRQGAPSGALGFCAADGIARVFGSWDPGTALPFSICPSRNQSCNGLRGQPRGRDGHTQGCSDGGSRGQAVRRQRGQCPCYRRETAVRRAREASVCRWERPPLLHIPRLCAGCWHPRRRGRSEQVPPITAAQRAAGAERGLGGPGEGREHRLLAEGGVRGG